MLGQNSNSSNQLWNQITPLSCCRYQGLVIIPLFAQIPIMWLRIFITDKTHNCEANLAMIFFLNSTLDHRFFIVMIIITTSSYFKPIYPLFLLLSISFGLFLNYRSQDSVLSPAASFTVPSGVTQGNDSEWTSLGPSPAVTSVCQEETCHNGGTCRPISLSSGSPSFQCDCPLRFTGDFCEKGNQSSLSSLFCFITSPESRRDLKHIVHILMNNSINKKHLYNFILKWSQNPLSSLL